MTSLYSLKEMTFRDSDLTWFHMAPARNVFCARANNEGGCRKREDSSKHLEFLRRRTFKVFTLEAKTSWWQHWLNSETKTAFVAFFPNSSSFCIMHSISCIHIYIYIYTWNPNDPCFDWKGPSVGGLKHQNWFQSRYIMSTTWLPKSSSIGRPRVVSKFKGPHPSRGHHDDAVPGEPFGPGGPCGVAVAVECRQQLLSANGRWRRHRHRAELVEVLEKAPAQWKASRRSFAIFFLACILSYSIYLDSRLSVVSSCLPYVQGFAPFKFSAPHKCQDACDLSQFNWAWLLKKMPEMKIMFTKCFLARSCPC